MKENNLKNEAVLGANLPDLSQRIAKIRQVFCEDQNVNFAEKIGKDPTYTSQLCSGSKNAGKKILDKILAEFPSVRRCWLYLGEGSMLVGDNFSGDIHDNNVGGDLLGNGAMKTTPENSRDVSQLIDVVSRLSAVVEQQTAQVSSLIEILKK